MYHRKDHPNQSKNNGTLCDEKEHIRLSLKKSQWKLSQQHADNIPLVHPKDFKSKGWIGKWPSENGRLRLKYYNS